MELFYKNGQCLLLVNYVRQNVIIVLMVPNLIFSGK